MQVTPETGWAARAARWHPAAAAAAFFPVHFAATAIGNELLVATPSAAAFWPASGTLIAALLLFPRRAWPWLFASGFLAEYSAYTGLQHVYPARTAALIGLVNIGQNLLAAELVGRWIGPRIDFAAVVPTARLVLRLRIATFCGGFGGAAGLVWSGTAP